jgi:hypothetical protein
VKPAPATITVPAFHHPPLTGHSDARMKAVPQNKKAASNEAALW